MKASIFWFTGMSGAGKSTLCELIKPQLLELRLKVFILDGDEFRKKYCQDLGFSKEDITQNNLRMISFLKEEQDKFNVILAPIISPLSETRQIARSEFSPNFYEIHCLCNREELIERDPKGLYRKAINGEIKNLIGFNDISSYESPLNPDLILDSSEGKKILLKNSKTLLNFILSKF